MPNMLYKHNMLCFGVGSFHSYIYRPHFIKLLNAKYQLFNFRFD
jgi:hypothetical protein